MTLTGDGSLIPSKHAYQPSANITTKQEKKSRPKADQKQDDCIGISDKSIRELEEALVFKVTRELHLTALDDLKTMQLL